MSIAQQSSIPAGWYPDPEGRPEKRWWNGSGWTGSYAPVVSAPVAVSAPAPAVPMTFMLTDPSQLASVPPGPGYSSLLATLSRTPTYADPITAPTDLAGGAYATAPAPSVYPPKVTPPAPVASSPAVLAIAAAPVEESAPAAFTPPASWAPPVVPTAPVPASIANPEPRVFSYAPDPNAEVPREFRVKAPSPYLAPVALAPVAEPVAVVAPTVAAAAVVSPVVAAPEEQFFGTTNFGTPRLAPVGLAGSTPLVAPFAAPVRDERPVDLSAVADDGLSYQPFGMVPVINRGQVGPPAIVYTGSAWVLAALPLLAGGAAISLVLFLSEFYSRFAQLGLLAVVVLVAFIAAARDRKELVDAGHHNAASVAWVVLSPLAYLTVRTVRTYKLTRRGFGPLIATIVATGILAAALVVLPEWVPALLLNPLD